MDLGKHRFICGGAGRKIYHALRKEMFTFDYNCVYKRYCSKGQNWIISEFSKGDPLLKLIGKFTFHEEYSKGRNGN